MLAHRHFNNFGQQGCRARPSGLLHACLSYRGGGSREHLSTPTPPNTLHQTLWMPSISPYTPPFIFQAAVHPFIASWFVRHCFWAHEDLNPYLNSSATSEKNTENVRSIHVLRKSVPVVVRSHVTSKNHRKLNLQMYSQLTFCYFNDEEGCI